MTEVVRSSQFSDSAERADLFLKAKDKGKKLKDAKEAFEGKKFDDLSESERSDLLKVVAIRLGIIED